MKHHGFLLGIIEQFELLQAAAAYVERLVLLPRERVGIHGPIVIFRKILLVHPLLYLIRLRDPFIPQFLPRATTI